MHFTISILIPALNEAINIGRCLTSIKSFVPANISFEVIVGDHGSQDKTAQIAADSGALVVQYAGGTVGSLRNYLVSKSTGNIIVFLDADVSVTAEWGSNLKSAIAALAHDANCITGSMCSVPDTKNPFIQYWFKVLPREKSNYLGTGHMIVPRALFEKIGGFNELLRSGEDFDLCTRGKSIGATILIDPSLKVIHHDFPLTIPAFLKRECWHGTGDFQSLASVLRSKVALATLVFLGLLLAVVVTGFAVGVVGSFAAVCLMLTYLSAMSFLKFKKLKLEARFFNIGIFALYFFGRSLSIFTILSNQVAKLVNGHYSRARVG